MASDPSILKLTDQQPFAIGGRRLCFVHPLEPDKCIKVLRHDDQRTVRLQSKKKSFLFSLRREYDNNAHEKQILDRLMQSIGPDMSHHLPLCYGYVETDLGPGLVLDLVRDHEGPISRSLRELISVGFELEQFRPAFKELEDFFVKHVILTRAVLDHNITVQHRADGSWRMVVIDGLGDPAFLPLARWIPAIGRAKMRRRFAEAWPRFEKLTKNKVTQELIDKSTWGQGFLNHRG